MLEAWAVSAPHVKQLRAWRASSNSSSCSWLCRPSLALNMGYLL